MNLLVTFSVNFPQQAELPNSLCQGAHARPAQDPPGDAAL